MYLNALLKIYSLVSGFTLNAGQFLAFLHIINASHLSIPEQLAHNAAGRSAVLITWDGVPTCQAKRGCGRLCWLDENAVR